jgi:integrase
MQPQTRARTTPEHRRKIAVAGHPGIYKKGERYLVMFRHKGRQKARSFRTLSEAVRFKGKVDAGETQPTSREPFKRYAERWIESYTGRTSSGVGNSTRASYADALSRVAMPYFGTTRMDEIDAPMLRDYIVSLVGKKLSPSTIRRYYAPVRALLATAYEDGLIRTNPALGVRVIAPSTTEKKRRLTVEQTRGLLAEMPAEDADFACLLAATGMRISEALSLLWSDLGQSSDGRPGLTIRKSKTASGERMLSLSPETARRLVRRRADAKFANDNDAIFPNRFGKPMDDHNWRQRVFNPAAERAGVGWATPHTLRHGLATLMDEHNYTAAQIAAQLGHADGGALAMKTYVHAEIPDAPSFIDALFAQPAGVNAGVNSASESGRTSPNP